MTKFLNKQEAAAFIGKSESTLRKWRETITKKENHPNRDGIQPSATDVARFHSQKKPFEFIYSTDLLRTAFKISDDETQPIGEGTVATNSLLKTLQDQLAVKDGQIAEKDSQITSLTEANKQIGERLRESQTLQLGMQQRLGIGPNQVGNESAPAEVVVTPPMPSSTEAESTGKESTKKANRKGLLNRIGRAVFG